MRRLCRAAAVAGIAALLGLAAAQTDTAGQLFGRLIARGVQAFAGEDTAIKEIVLPEVKVYALQLAVFDSAEGASAEAERLSGLGIRCMVWQKEKYRLISDVALSKDALDMRTAKGQDAYVVAETLNEVRLRVGAGKEEINRVSSLLLLPDAALTDLISGKPLQEEIDAVRQAAVKAHSAYPGHALCSALAENLSAWCDMMEKEEYAGSQGYGKAAMFALCRQLRQALMAESTASAQRTPSTAADVMPPA